MLSVKQEMSTHQQLAQSECFPSRSEPSHTVLPKLRMAAPMLIRISERSPLSWRGCWKGRRRCAARRLAGRRTVDRHLSQAQACADCSGSGRAAGGAERAQCAAAEAQQPGAFLHAAAYLCLLQGTSAVPELLASSGIAHVGSIVHLKPKIVTPSCKGVLGELSLFIGDSPSICTWPVNRVGAVADPGDNSGADEGAERGGRQEVATAPMRRAAGRACAP